MRKLLKELKYWTKKFNDGNLTAEEAETAAGIARELFENWVYIKYKKQNRNVAQDPVVQSFKEAFTMPRNEIKPPAPEKKAVRNYPEPAIETIEKPAVSENQTTLIDIIREIQEDQTIHDRITKGQVRETLADKHSKKPIPNLKKHIGLNQKYSFIKHLFDNDKQAYDDAIEKLNACANFLEADDYIQNHLRNKYGWEEETVHVIKFMDIVERRYIPVLKQSQK